MDTWVDCSGKDGGEGAHGKAEDSNAVGVDVVAVREIGDALHDVGDHAAAHARGHRCGIEDFGVVFAGSGFAVVVGFSGADWVIRENDGAEASVKDRGVVRVPAGLVGTVSVDQDHCGQFGFWSGGGVVDDGGDSHAVLGRVGDAFGGDFGGRVENAVGLSLEFRQGIRDEERLFDLLAPDGDLFLRSNFGTSECAE